MPHPFQDDDEEFLHPDYPEVPCPAPLCPASFCQLVDFGAHYATLHRHECSMCARALPSAHMLELHLAETHDSFFAVASRSGIEVLILLQPKTNEISLQEKSLLRMFPAKVPGEVLEP